MIMTQRLAHYHTFNASSFPSTMAFFRIAHVDHEVLKDPALDGVWLEYRGTEKYLEVKSANNGGAGATAIPGPGASSASFLNDVQGLQMAPDAAPANYWNSVPAAVPEIAVAHPYTPQVDN